MAGFNKVILIGNLVSDPELRYTPSGTAVCDVPLAVTTKRGRDKKENTCFIDCTIWGKQAEAVANYMRKGRQITIEGHLAQESWETRDGGKRNKHKIQVENVVFLGERGRGGGRQEAKADPVRESAPQEPPRQDNDLTMGSVDAEDDVPF